MVRKLLILTLFVGTLMCGESKDKGGKDVKQKSSTDIYMVNASTEENEKKEVETVYRKFYEYKISKNIKELDKILDEEFILTHMTGYRQSKDEWFSQIEDEQMKYYGYTVDSIKIEINGDEAVLTGRSKTDARIYGSRNKWNLELVMPMKKNNGKWIITEAVASSY